MSSAAQCWPTEGLINLIVPCTRPDSKFQRDLVSLRTNVSNVTSSTMAEVQALHSQGEPGWKGLWTGMGRGGGGWELPPQH